MSNPRKPRKPAADKGAAKKTARKRGARSASTRARTKRPPKPPAPPVELATEPAAPEPAAPPKAWLPTISDEPPADVIERVLASIERGAFQVAAWAEEGVSSSMAAKWMTIGEANSRCAAEGLAPLDWRGSLYRRTLRATSRCQTPVMHKLFEQARADGGRLAIEALDLRFFRNGGYAQSNVGRGLGQAGAGGVGRDFPDGEAQVRDLPSADEMIAQLDAAIANAVEAAKLKAAETGGG